MIVKNKQKMKRMQKKLEIAIQKNIIKSYQKKFSGETEKVGK